MNREQKLSLIIGFTLILLVGVLISDHLSGARTATVSGVAGEEAGLFDARLASRDTVEPFDLDGADGDRAGDRGSADPGGASVDAGATFLDEAVADADPIAGSEERAEPFAVIDQSASAGDDVGLLAELARQGGRLIGRGAERVLELPASAAPLAKTEKAEAAPTRWHTVAQGESLWEIAERYYGRGDLWKALAEHNTERVGEARSIRVGVRLAIPAAAALGVRRADAGARSSPSAGAGEARPVPTRSYTVRKNDTIGEIAQRLLGTARRWREIARLNDIEDEDVLYEGQVLKIPAK